MEMSEIAIGMAAPEGVALTVLTHLQNGKIDDAIARFVEKPTFKDHGIGLEFKDTERLSEFFRKTRELYPDSSLETDTIFVSGDHVIMEWKLPTMVTESFYGGLSRTVHVSVHGASIVRTENGKITEWADYYDGLTARRTALAAHFMEWVEL
jgi:ketosteroid isomerase-like protein